MSAQLGLNSYSINYSVRVNDLVEAASLHHQLLSVYEKHKYLRYGDATILVSSDGKYYLKYKLFNINKNESGEEPTENYRRSEFFKHT